MKTTRICQPNGSHGARRANACRHAGVRTTRLPWRRFSYRHQQGVALVVTMILLALITTLAVAFLALTHGETRQVDMMHRTTDAEQACESARERGMGEMRAQLVSRDPLNPLNVRTNPMGPDFTVSVASDTNRLGPGSGVGGMSYFFDPSPPVFVDTNRPGQNGSVEDRFYHDLNRNGWFEETGYIPATSDAPGPAPGTFQPLRDAAGNIVNEFTVGDPQWIGIPQNPLEPHGPTNRFIGRYAWMIQPIGRSLDVNWVHNDAKTVQDPSPGLLNYYRNQNVGGYEINLAAFLCDLNSNVWNRPVGPYNAVPYNYTTNPSPAMKCSGTAFDDAWQILEYRYNGPKRDLDTLNALFAPRTAAEVGNYMAFDLIDTYANGPSDPFLADDDNSVNPWPGADSKRHFYSIHDLFKLQGAALTQGKGFVERLQLASSMGNSYDRYTYYRLLSQLGTDSAPEDENKININYMNIRSWAEPNVRLRATDLISWTNGMDPDGTVMIPRLGRTVRMGRRGPELFFLTVATNLFAREPDLRFIVTNAPLGIPLQIPLRVNGSTVITNGPLQGPRYAGRIHQILQLAANIYDATTGPKEGEGFPFYPSVFRPQYRVENGNVAITNYVLETEKAAQIMFNPTRPWRDLALGQDPNPDDGVYGIPLVIGARKGLPNFNEFASRTSAMAVRRLRVIKGLGETNLDQAKFRQELILQITNEFGMEAWNSYLSNIYPRPLQLVFSNRVSVQITNTQDPPFPIVSTGTNFFPAPFPAYGWRSNSFVTNRIFSSRVFYWTNVVENDRGGNTNLWGVTITNHMLFFLVDNERIIDAVSLAIVNDPFPLGAEMATRLPGVAATREAVAMLWDRRTENGKPWTKGIQHQLDISTVSSLSGQQDWDNYAVDAPSKDASITAFNDFIRDPMRTIGEAGFAAVRRMISTNYLRVNDPLVHYTLEDLHPSASTATVASKIYPNFVLGGRNPESRSWNAGRSDPAANPGVDTVNPLLRDPGIRSSDNWDFPTGPFATVGQLGRVHRGTPWQTVYLKSKPQAGTPIEVWRRHSGPGRSLNNAKLMHPLRDWELIDLFTAAPHPNATRGQLSVNQTNLAAWSAVLSGIITSGATDNPDDGHAVPQPEVVVPAAFSDHVSRIVEGINVARTNFGGGQFHRLGDLLSVPELTYKSPFLERAIFAPEAPNGTEEIYDADYERIPQQILSLTKLGEARFVIYAWGQSLKPARNGVRKQGNNIELVGPSILTADSGGMLKGTCINYQITGEMATRTVVRVDYERFEDTGELDYGHPHLVIESFNVLPNE